MTIGKDIPRDIALKLCDEIRAENKQRWFSTLEASMLLLLQVCQGRCGKAVHIQRTRLSTSEQTIQIALGTQIKGGYQ